MRTTICLVICVAVCGFAFAQNSSVLPAQVEAILSLAAQNGFTNVQLNKWLEKTYQSNLSGLSRSNAALVIQAFQSDSPPTPQMVPAATGSPTTPVVQKAKPTIATPSAPTQVKKKAKKPVIATILEPGMSKRFHLVDGNIILGTIVSIENSICTIETVDGTLKIPATDILEETAQITKKDDARYVGPVLKEDSQEIVLRSKYGDVIINKKDIKDMSRYHGGKLVPWAEEKKTFYQGSEILTDLLMDPTAFPLEANTFYISGLSLGYGFTDKFMLRTKFGNDFGGDLNLQAHYRFYHNVTASKESGAAIGFSIHRSFTKTNLVAKYAHFVMVDATSTLNESDMETKDVLVDPDGRLVFAETYFVVSNRRPLESGRGKVGTHFGFRTNTMPFHKGDLLATPYKWSDTGEFIIPFRLFAGFEYDLSKNLKFMAEAWADNSNRYIAFSDAWKDYFGDSTTFVFDSPAGTYSMLDFDFGFLYSVSETFRLGIHFQQPYLVFYWEFYEL